METSIISPALVGPSRDRLGRLLAHQGSPRVTIRHLPFASVDENPDAGRLRLESLLDEARQQLAEGDAHILDPAPELAADTTGDRRDCVVALWLADGLAEAAVMPSTGAPAPSVHVGHRFLASDLVLAPLRWPPYVVAAVDRSGGRLIAVGSDRSVACHRLEPPPVPVDEPEARIQHHSVGAATGGGAPVAWHGHGGAKDASNEPIRRILQGMAADVDERLRGRSLPLVLAAGPEIVGAWSRSLSHPHLVEDHLTVNPEGMDDRELARAAEPLVLEWLQQHRLARHERLGGPRPGNGWANGPEGVTKAVNAGRVDTLFVNETAIRDPELAAPTDLAVVGTWRTDGNVVLMPGDEEPVLEAHLRW